MGACSESYIIETSVGTVNLPIRNASVFELPVVLKEFDVLFQRIVNRYKNYNFSWQDPSQKDFQIMFKGYGKSSYQAS